MTLLRGWFLYFIWLFVSSGGLLSYPRKLWPWPTLLLWQALVFGTAATIFLLYRRHRFAGIVGFVSVLPLCLFLLGQFLDEWNRVALGQRFTVYRFGFPVSNVTYFIYTGILLIVPAVTLARHLASRHRLMLYERASDIDTEQPMRRRRGGYYFVTAR